jgi:hypothetical protein
MRSHGSERANTLFTFAFVENSTVQHGTAVDYPGGLQQLANDLGNLRYDSLAQFLHLLSDKIEQDGEADLGRNRPKLAGHLHRAAEEIARAWQLCKPFMTETE